MSNPAPAYLYLRFSTPRQERGSSKERQLEDCRDFIKRKGWQEAEVIADLGRSAWKGAHLKSGNLGKFAARIFDGDIPMGSVLVVEDLDRLSRQKPMEVQAWIHRVCEAGIKIASVKGNKVFDADNFSDSLMDIFDVLFQADAANKYAERLSRRSKASYESRLKDAREKGTAVHSVGPAWLQAVGKRPNIEWEHIPARVKIVREIYDLTAAGQAPWAIAKTFNQRGEVSFTGKAWERTSIVKMLRNRAVEGDRVVGEGKASKPTGEVLLGHYGKPIVPLDVIAEARAMLDRRQIRKGKGRNSGAVNNLFGQSVRCGVCEGRMMLTGYKSRYLVCYEASRGNGCDHRARFKYRNLESAVLDTLLPLALGERFFRQAQKSNHLGLEIATVEKAIRDKRAEAGRLVALLKRVESPTTEAVLVEAESEIKRLESVLADTNTKLAQAQGQATADQHLKRMVGVREALAHPQDEVRLPARLKVAEAMHAVGFRAVAAGPGVLAADDERALFYIELGGETPNAEPMHTLWITGDGEVVADDPRPQDFVLSWAEVSPTADRYLRNAERRKPRVGRGGKEAA